MFYHLKESKFYEKRVKFYAACIAVGLNYFHERKIVYRDLKPENLFMDEKGYICLTDFGIARLMMLQSKHDNYVGTGEYLAPEVL